jgi:NAD(P)-dependent dehydrogenase (short-subunit alcohol dehydrogenase family)
MTTRDLFDLTGKSALVTGGSRGIGLQMAHALADMGARLALTARKQDELDAARAQLESAGAECVTIAGDLSDGAGVPRCVDEVLARYGALDILVNNAGTNWAAPAESYPDEAWRKVMSLNVDAQFKLAREVAKRTMIPRRSGKIINIASVNAFYANPPEWAMYTAGYIASKGAVVSMTRALAAEWGRYNINVNAICPGFFPSKMTQAALQRIEKSLLAMTPLGRIGGDQDLKGGVVFLASEASRHVTGQALVIDGGSTIV